MVTDLSPHPLRWHEVDPARHPFDGDTAAQVIRSLEPARHVPVKPAGSAADRSVIAWSRDEGRSWADSMSSALAERYGRWVLGWRWAHDEGDFDGGPVGSWCCPRDSITTADETLDRVVAGVREWRAWLEELAALFERYPLDRREEGVRAVILRVADRTGGGSSWYGHCEQALTWFLERWDVPVADARKLVRQAIGGRFESWTTPAAGVVSEVADRISNAVDTEVPDHLATWLVERAEVVWPPEASPRKWTRDGALDSVEDVDAVDPDRAERMRAALRQVRVDVARGAVLDFALLRGWQHLVLGAPQEFRTSPAFAKQGQERYGVDGTTRARFDACLAESDEDGLDVAARAARAYLDVCFFHPFDDGNARAAFLVLVFVLAREGFALSAAGLLRSVSYWADAQDARMLARNIGFQLTRG
ncbi:Fic family protein [Lentzea sp. JNUCC 0626]|uniref:Fic family protein n=1 Tax=Lentzea sp. JNUCC 0626 TaxID=3367513 RepID=UPI003747B00F